MKYRKKCNDFVCVLIHIKIHLTKNFKIVVVLVICSTFLRLRFLKFPVSGKQ